MSSIALIEESSSAPGKIKSKPPRIKRSFSPQKTRRKPLSARKLAANRRNAAKSTGPRTPAGKQKSSQNAVKHALCSQSARLATEDGPTYNIFLDELREDLHPANAIQNHLFHQLASILWRLQRANDTENQLYSLNQKHDDPPCLTLAKAFQKNPSSNPFLLYSRYERHLRNTYLRLLRELRQMQTQDEADAAAEARRRGQEPAWSLEKERAQIERCRREKESAADRLSESQKSDWYKEMIDRRIEREKQRRLEDHRQQNQRIEAEAKVQANASSGDTPVAADTPDGTDTPGGADIFGGADIPVRHRAQPDFSAADISGATDTPGGADILSGADIPVRHRAQPDFNAANLPGATDTPDGADILGGADIPVRHPCRSDTHSTPAESAQTPPTTSAPQTTNHTQQTIQNEPTETHLSHPQSPSTPPQPPLPPSPAQNKFDESNPPPSPKIEISPPAPYTNPTLESTNT